MDIDDIIKLLKDENINSLLNKNHGVEGIEIRRAVVRDFHLVDTIVGLDREKSKPIIDVLKNMGLLEIVKAGNYIVCPYCESINVHEFYTCPYCGSTNLKKIYMVQHLECGQTFSTEDLHIDRCPRCNGEIKGLEDIKLIGGLFKCLDCGEHFELPNIKYKCLSCGMEFTVKEAMVKNIEGYRLTEKAKLFLKIVDGYRVMSEVLRDEGYEVESPSTVKGESGVLHEFPLVIKVPSKNNFYAIDITGLYTMLGNEDILKLFTRIIDTPQIIHLLVINKNLNPNATSNFFPIRGQYKIIEAGNLEEAIIKIKLVISERESKVEQ